MGGVSREKLGGGRGEKTGREPKLTRSGFRSSACCARTSYWSLDFRSVIPISAHVDLVDGVVVSGSCKRGPVLMSRFT